jgi:cobalt/nickel transport system permease protein
MNKDLGAVLVYIGAVLGVTAVHHPAFFAVILAAASLLAGGRWGRLALKSIRAIAVFNSIVTVSYVALASARGDPWLEYILLVNMRVFVLTFMTFLASSRINVLRAVSFSKKMSYVITVALGQLVTFRRMLGDFKMAVASRTIRRPRMTDSYHRAASSAAFFFSKALNDASEITDGMKSRGFFDD